MTRSSAILSRSKQSAVRRPPPRALLAGATEWPSRPPIRHTLRVASLRYRDEEGHEHVHALAGERPVTIGRGEQADVRVTWDPSVSGLHAELIPPGVHWLLSDDGL